LLDRAARTVDAAALDTIAKEVHKTTSKIAALPELDSVVSEVNNQLTTMVGDKHAVQTALGFAPTDPERLLRTLQLMIDGGKRGISEASLGSANVLYLALKQLEQHTWSTRGNASIPFSPLKNPKRTSTRTCSDSFIETTCVRVKKERALKRSEA
jgi:putative ATP-dependent endonuclease of OLD family